MAATHRRLVAFALCTVLLAPGIGAQQGTGGIPGVEFVDVNPVLFNADGTSRLELFMGDGLHLRPRPRRLASAWVALDKLPYRLQSASLEIPGQECVPSLLVIPSHETSLACHASELHVRYGRLRHLAEVVA